MKKALVIGLVAILICIASAPIINANLNIISNENPQIFKKVESKTKEITPYLHDLFLFGRISNVRRGGYTPAYWFHIDKVMTYGNQDPKLQYIEDCEAHMLSMDFRGFVFKNIIIGRVSELLIYN
jgi:hypothetical protein